MLKKQQQMRIMDDALEFMKREYAARMEEVARKEAKLARDKAALDAMVERFRDFIQDNDAKKDKARKKTEDEKKACAKLDEEILSLEEQLRARHAEMQALRDQTSRLQRFSEFLTAAAERSGGEFRESGELLSRYRTLDTIHGAQQRSISSNQDEMDRLRSASTAVRAHMTNRCVACL